MPAPVVAVDNAVSKLTRLNDFTNNGMENAQEVALDVEETTPDSEIVKDLEDAMMEFVAMEREMNQWAAAVNKAKRQFQRDYNPDSDEIPDMEALFKQELDALQASNKDTDITNHPRIKEFKKKVWDVHHQGQPLPDGEETEMDDDEDLRMTQGPAEQTKCPITQVEMKEPMKSARCGHNYEKAAIMELISKRERRGPLNCPVSGCPHKVTRNDLEPNAALQRHIQRNNRKR